MKTFDKSSKLDNVLYDVRGPVVDEAARMEADGLSILKLNIGNPAPFGFNAPEEVILDMRQSLWECQGYSDSKGLFSARKAIMQYCQLKKIPGVTMDDIYTGNGVSELINLSMQALLNDGDEILIPAPDYPLWTATATLAGGNVVHYVCDEQSDWYPDIDDIRSKITDKTKAIVIINPNNPTGTYVNSAKVEEFIRKLPDHVIPVVDEAYFEYVEDPTHYSLIKMIQEGYDRPLFVLRTFSKIYGMAGLRIGYTFADPLLIDELMKACQAWNVSYNALAAAQAALKDQEYIKKIKALTTAGREYLEDELTKLGCTLAKPCANFIYFDTHHDPKEIRAALAERKIMISAFGFNRVSVGTEEQNKAFIAALKEILAAY